MNLALLVAADERMCFVAILDFHGNHDGPDQRSSPRELFLRPLLQYISVPSLINSRVVSVGVVMLRIVASKIPPTALVNNSTIQTSRYQSSG